MITCCKRDISLLFLISVLYPHAEWHFGPTQVSKTELFVRIVNVFNLAPLTIFAKSSIADIWRTLWSTLVFMVFGIHCNFFFVYLFNWKYLELIVFSFLTRQNVLSLNIGCVSGILLAQEFPKRSPKARKLFRHAPSLL